MTYQTKPVDAPKIQPILAKKSDFFFTVKKPAEVETVQVPNRKSSVNPRKRKAHDISSSGEPSNEEESGSGNHDKKLEPP